MCVIASVIPDVLLRTVSCLYCRGWQYSEVGFGGCPSKVASSSTCCVAVRSQESAGMVSSFWSGQGMVLPTLMPPPGQVPGPSFLKGGDACLFFGMNHGCSLFLTLVCISVQHAKSALHMKTEMLLQPGGPARVHFSHLHALPHFLERRPHSVPCSLTALCS